MVKLEYDSKTGVLYFSDRHAKKKQVIKSLGLDKGKNYYTPGMFTLMVEVFNRYPYLTQDLLDWTKFLVEE